MANKGLNLQLGLLYYNQRKNRCTFEDWKPAEVRESRFLVWLYQTNEKGVCRCCFFEHRQGTENPFELLHVA